MTYAIYRFYAPHLNKKKEKIASGLSLDEAQAHCQDPTTSEPGQWFDGYESEGSGEMSADELFAVGAESNRQSSEIFARRDPDYLDRVADMEADDENDDEEENEA